MPDFNIVGNVGLNTGASGLLMGLDPAYQQKQADAAAAQLALKRATAFQNGVPTNPDGSIDIDAIGRTQIQNGDAAGGLGLLMTGQKLALLRDPSTISNPTGQGSGGGILSAATGAQPAAGGGAIAPAAGGDSYGRAPGGEYAGVGQIGPGGIGQAGSGSQGGQGPAPAGSQAGQGSPSSGGLDPLDVYAHSIGSIESGNRYDALGPKQANGAQAIGRYQVMSTNIPSWTKEVLGQEMTPEDFRANPQAQDAVFRAKFGQAVDQYGNPMDAASVWFSGRPLARAGNATDSLGTNVPSYVQKFAAGLGPAVTALRGGQGQALAGGQGSAPAGSSASLISFGGPAATSSDGTPTPTPAGGVTDSQVMAARKLVAQNENADPSTMTLDQQRAVSAATDTIARYQDQQAQPSGPSSAPVVAPVTASPGTSDGRPTSAVSATPATGQHPFFPPSSPQTGGTPAPGGLPTVTVGAQPGRQPPQAGGAPAMAPGGVQPISFSGSSPQAAPATPAAPVGAMPPAVAAALTRLQNRQGSPADGALWGAYQRNVGSSVSGAIGGAGTAAPGSQPSGDGDRAAGNVVRQAMKDTAGPPGNVQGMQILSAAIPSPSTSPDGVKGVSAFQQGAIDYQNARKQASDVNAFTANVTPATMVLRRLQQDQPVVFATTVAQLKQSPAGQAVLDAASQGMRYLATNGGGLPAGASPQGGQGSSASPAPATGPDLPYLQGKYAAPGGGAQYVSDLLDQARKYGLAGEQQAAQAYETRAKQVQDDLAAINKSRLDLQTHNAELGDQQKLYRDAQGQGFQGTYLDFQNALAAGKANANAAGRNATLTPGEKEYQQAVAGGFQGTQADYQASVAAQKAEADGQGKYLGGLPAKYAAAADAGRAANDNVDQMLSAAQGFRMGAGAGIQQDARKALQGTLGFLGVSDPKLNDPTASYEDFGKMAGAHLRNVVSAISGPKGVQELQLVGSSLPSAEQSYDGFRAVSASLKGSNDFAIAKQQASQDWLADPSHRNSLSGFEATFNKNVTPSAFWLNRLRVDQPDLFTQSVQRLGQTDQGRALLAKAKAGMTWANSNGLLN